MAKPVAPPAPPAAPPIPVPAAATLPDPEPPVPLATPVAAEPDPAALAFDSGPGVVVPPTRRTGRRRSRRTLAGPILKGIILGAVLSGVAWGGIWVYHYVKENEPATNEDLPGIKDTEALNCKFVLPGAAWQHNPDLTAKMAVNFCLSQKKPSNNVALYCFDYRTRLPSEAEMLDTALGKLRRLFRPLEWERKTSSPRKLGNQPAALHLEFQGADGNNVEMAGEVLVLGYQGFGYWFFTWCPADQKDILEAEWSKLRECFSLRRKRDGWKETPRPRDRLAIAETPYALEFVKEVWKPQPPDKWDPNARVVLLGSDPNEPKHAGKAANFRLIVLEKAPGVKEAFDVAQKYLLEKEKEEYSETVITPLKNKDGKDQVSLTNLGDERGYLGKFEVRNTEERMRYMVLAAVKAPENTLMLLCDADLARKDFWDTEFAELLRSLRKKKD